MIQDDHRNPDDHLFLYSACRRFGVWYSPAGNGVSHPVHQERFGRPGRTLLGSDSHTPAAGAIGMLAIGAGGIEVALAMAGQPFYFKMPRVLGVELFGTLPDWVSAKDVALEMLRRHGVKGGVGQVVEYHGPGLEGLSTMDRHVIANMGTELGATTTVFPSDAEVRRFLKGQGREAAWEEWAADEGASYDETERIDLSTLEPLIAMPSSPGNVRPVREVAGEPIYQAYVGSSANPGYRDFAVTAEMVKGRRVQPHVSLDINPTSRQILQNLVKDGHLFALIKGGARIHQAGCNGCIGMGQAPASHQISLRTVPRNFPGRSGTREDKVCLVSPETAAASALTGVITDPRTLDMPYPRVHEPTEPDLNTEMLVPPLPPHEAQGVELDKGPNISTLPELEPLPDEMELFIALKVGDDVSTDEIMPAGSRVLPYRSNIERISEFCFEAVDLEYATRARDSLEQGKQGHLIVGGENYGQGSSREHAALAPRHLGLRVVLAKSIARIHWQNLVNFGVLPLTFHDPSDYDALERGDALHFTHLSDQVKDGPQVIARSSRTDNDLIVEHALSERQIDVLFTGGLIRWLAGRLESTASG